VPVPERLPSLFEPHTSVILRFKAGKRVEFGRTLRLDEVEGMARPTTDEEAA
jgi:IS5 family transposase